MDAPLVSVVIPVHDGEKYLAETLESVLAQDYAPTEVIVVDDGSTDRSAEIARSFERVRYLHQANAGPGAARNAGVAAAKGSLVAFLDVDDTWTKDKLSVQVGHHRAHPEVAYSFTHRRLVFLEGSEPPPRFRQLPLEHPGIHCSTLLVSKDAFARVGGFSTDRRPGEDADWFARAAEVLGEAAIVPAVLLHSRLYDKHGPEYVERCRAALMRVLKASIDRKRRAGRPRPLVSVIIPAWNAERYLAETLESILAQDHEPKEVIVVDDGSTDRTAEVVRSFGARVRYERQENAGCNAARNRGFEVATGDLIVHFDADDLMPEGAVRARVDALAADPQLEGVTGIAESFFSADASEELRKKTRLLDPVPGQILGALLMRRRAAARVGPMVTTGKTALQTHWWMRATDVGLKVKMLPVAVLRRRIHETNWSLRPGTLHGHLVALKAALDLRRKSGGTAP